MGSQYFCRKDFSGGGVTGWPVESVPTGGASGGDRRDVGEVVESWR